MFEKFMKPNKTSEKKVVEEERKEAEMKDELIEFVEGKDAFMEFIKQSNSDKMYEIIDLFARDNGKTMQELRNVYTYLSSKPKPSSRRFVVSIKSYSQNDTFVSQYTEKIVRRMFSHFFFPKAENYVINSKNIIENKFNNPTDYAKDSILSITDVDYLAEVASEGLKKFEKFVDNLPECLLIIKHHDENQLNYLHFNISTSPDFKFEFNNEVSVEEFTHIFRVVVGKEFKLEENWEKYLQSYIERSKQVRDLKLYITMQEKIKKEYELSGNNDSTIRCKFFGVKVFGIDAKTEDLKGIEKLSKLIGMEDVKEKVKQLIAYLEFNEKLRQKTGKAYPLNLHMCFTGNPGTGKTTIARIIAEILFELGYVAKNKLVEVDKKDLVSQWVGHTSIKTDEIIKSAIGGVLFVDEAYSVADDRFGKDAIATLIKSMEDYKSNLVVIFAGYEAEMGDFIKSNPGIKSRIGSLMKFKDYSTDELLQIYNNKLNDYQILTNENALASIEKIVDNCKKEESFGNGRFIDNLIQDILFKHASNLSDSASDDSLLIINEQDIPEKYENN